jgi:uncharacterized membrane protein YdcZ (DUF606 family)
VQVALMSRFGERIGVVEALAFSTLLTALLSFGCALAARQSLARLRRRLRAPVWLWAAGVMGLIVIFTITFATPRSGRPRRSGC